MVEKQLGNSQIRTRTSFKSFGDKGSFHSVVGIQKAKESFNLATCTIFSVNRQPLKF